MRKYAGEYAVVITDYDVHWLWAQKNMDVFFVATKEEAVRLTHKGVDADKINVTGIPVKPQFALEYDKKQMRRALGLDEDKKTILMMTGAYGAGKIEAFIEQLVKSVKYDFQAIVMTGKNKEMYKAMRNISKEYPGKLVPVKFTKEVYKYMAASDFVFTKTGGLTTSECLAMGLPIVTINPIPGQEDHNTNFLLENGVCLKAYDYIGLLIRIEKLLGDDELLKGMQANARKIAKPDAANTILKFLGAE